MVSQEIARKQFRNLERSAQNTPRELVLDFDEVGSREWADRTKREVNILRQVRLGRAECAVSRSEDRISCITPISMAGDVLMPLLVIHGKTIDDAV
jgi:hypothetical protein